MTITRPEETIAQVEAMETPTVLGYAFTFDPDHIFHILVQIGETTSMIVDYRDFQLHAGSVSDESRPYDIRQNALSMREIANQFLDIPIYAQLPFMPGTVQWGGWDWSLMQVKPGGYTPIVLMCELYGFDGERAGQWYGAASVIPDHPRFALLMVRNRFGHFNYELTSADKILSIVSYIKGL